MASVIIDQSNIDRSNDRCAAGTRDDVSGDLIIDLRDLMPSDSQASSQSDAPTTSSTPQNAGHVTETHIAEMSTPIPAEVEASRADDSKNSPTAQTAPSSSVSTTTRKKPTQWFQYLDPRSLWITPTSKPKKEKFNDWERYDRIRLETIDEYPRGYPRLAAIQASDPNWPVYRRFKTLHHRIILHRQQELVTLERQLNELDRKDAEQYPYRLGSLKVDHEDAIEEGKERSEREEIIDKIDMKLKDYDELLQRERESSALERANYRNWHTIFTYISNKKPLSKADCDYIHLRTDFINLTQEQDTSFHKAAEDQLRKWNIKSLEKLFSTNEQRQMTKDKSIRLYSRTRINVLVQVIATAVATILFAVPVSLLTVLNISDRKRLAIIILSLIAFPLVIRPFSRPKSHELLAMTATYAAVLVIFVDFNNNEPQTGL